MSEAVPGFFAEKVVSDHEELSKMQTMYAIFKGRFLWKSEIVCFYGGHFNVGCFNRGGTCSVHQSQMFVCLIQQICM